MAELTVAFWNRRRNGNRDAQVDYLQRCAVPWDVLMLAEMSRVAFRDFRRRLNADGVSANLDAVTDRRYPNGVAVLARNGVALGEPAPVLVGEPDDDTSPRTERSLFVSIEAAVSHLTAAAWHAPYAAGRNRRESERNRATKGRAYAEMSTWLAQQPGPLVLGMDGNNWYEAETHVASTEGPFVDEHRFHGAAPGHGLVDTLRVARPEAVSALTAGGPPLGATRFARGPQRMDRIYASTDVTIVDAGIDYDGQDPSSLHSKSHLAPSSDHALVWARLRIPGPGGSCSSDVTVKTKVTRPLVGGHTLAVAGRGRSPGCGSGPRRNGRTAICPSAGHTPSWAARS